MEHPKEKCSRCEKLLSKIATKNNHSKNTRDKYNFVLVSGKTLELLSYASGCLNISYIMPLSY